MYLKSLENDYDKEKKKYTEPYYLTQEELRELQMVELELLQEADRICRKCNIHYNIIAGTLLGAVRHKGFIPWDDDADIALLRSEYERFREACKTELDIDKFYFQDHTNTPGYRWGYGKLRRKGTVFLRLNQEHMPYEQGIFIDVFPLDQVSDKQIIRSIKNLECFCVRKVLWSEVGRVAERNRMKRAFFKILSQIPVERVWKYYNRMVKKAANEQSEWVRILTFPTPNNKYGYKKEWYEASSTIVFEEISFIGIEQYEEYLTFKFGDYMQLPTVEQRKVHPVSKFELPR